MGTTEIEVLVVGAGAAGTMLSLELARHGVEARTVDRLSGPATTSKAITVHARTAEIFERIDPALAERFTNRGIHNKGYVLHFVDGEGRRSEVRPGLDFTGLDSDYPYLLIHRQSETEQFLREYLAEHFDRAPEWGIECLDVAHTDDGVTAVLRDSSGMEERVHCRYLIACDGMNSRVREALDLGQSEQDYAGTMMQNMDVFLDGFPDAEDYVHYCAGTDHFIMIVKLPGGFFRLLLSDRGEAADPDVEPKRAFGNLVDRHFDSVMLGDIVWHSKWDSRVRLAYTYRDRNVFLAGDSAHVHSTTGGQGMNCCIQDAWNLGWKLGYVLRGRAPVDLLDSYQSERRPVAEQVIWAASSLHDIFMAHGKDIGERAKQMDDAGFHDAVVGHCSGIDYTYRKCLGQPTVPLPGPANGDRLVDAVLGDGQRLATAAASTRFSLIGIVDDETAAPEIGRALGDWRKRFGDSVRTLTVPGSAAYRERYGEGSQIIAVRPDGYIGARGGPGNLSAPGAYLDNILIVASR